MSLTVRSPVAGVVVGLDSVPDPVFSGRIVGPGVAVAPDRASGEEVAALAPVGGTIAKIHPHAYIISTDEGRSVLVGEGEAVDAGQPVITWSPAHIEEHGLNPIVPVIALEGDESALGPTLLGRKVAAGDTLMDWA